MPARDMLGRGTRRAIEGSIFLMRAMIATAKLRLLYVGTRRAGTGIATPGGGCIPRVPRERLSQIDLWTNDGLVSARPFRKHGLWIVAEEKTSVVWARLVGTGAARSFDPAPLSGCAWRRAALPAGNAPPCAMRERFAAASAKFTAAPQAQGLVKAQKTGSD